MKILIKDNGKTFWFWIPNAFLNEKLICKFTKNEIPPQGITAIRDIRRALKTYTKAYGHFTLVDVEGADGEIVKISV